MKAAVCVFKLVCTHVLAAGIVIGAVGSAGAQTQTTATGSSADDGWKVNAYPILAWVPLGIGIDVSLPPTGGGGGGGKIIDGRFDGAFFGGFSVSHRFWRIDTAGLWAAVDQAIEQLRKDARNDINTLITASMRFPAGDAAKFWPLYKPFEQSRKEIT